MNSENSEKNRGMNHDIKSLLENIEDLSVKDVGPDLCSVHNLMGIDDLNESDLDVCQRATGCEYWSEVDENSELSDYNGVSVQNSTKKSSSQNDLANKECVFDKEIQNKIKAHEYSAKYRENNKELLKQRKRKNYEDNKDKFIERALKYQEENKDKAQQYTAKYREKNREVIKQKNRKTYEENKDKFIERASKYQKDNKNKAQQYTAKYRENNREEIKQKNRIRYQKNKNKKLAEEQKKKIVTNISDEESKEATDEKEEIDEKIQNIEESSPCLVPVIFYKQY